MSVNRAAPYQCKECGAPADLADGRLLRSCWHTGTVVTNMSAIAYGRGHASGAVQPSLFALFHRLGTLMLERLRGNRVQ